MNKKVVLGLSLLITMNMHGIDTQKCAVALEGILGVQRDLLGGQSERLAQQKLHLEEAKAQTQLRTRQTEEQAMQTISINAIHGALLEGNVRVVTALEKIGAQLAALTTIISRAQTDGVRGVTALEELVQVQRSQAAIQRDQETVLKALVQLASKFVDGEMVSLQKQIKGLESELAGKGRRRLARKQNPSVHVSPTARVLSVAVSQLPLGENALKSSTDEVASEHSSAAGDDAGDPADGAAEPTTE